MRCRFAWLSRDGSPSDGNTKMVAALRPGPVRVRRLDLVQGLLEQRVQIFDRPVEVLAHHELPLWKALCHDWDNIVVASAIWRVHVEPFDWREEGLQAAVLVEQRRRASTHRTGPRQVLLIYKHFELEAGGELALGEVRGVGKGQMRPRSPTSWSSAVPGLSRSPGRAPPGVQVDQEERKHEEPEEKEGRGPQPPLGTLLQKREHSLLRARNPSLKSRSTSCDYES